MIRLAVLVILVTALTLASPGIVQMPTTMSHHAQAQTPPPGSFTLEMGGQPTAPEPWHPDDVDVAIHSRDRATFDTLEAMDGEHSMACAGPPAVHAINGSYPDSVFLCANHVMTAIKAGGYGVIYITPPAQLDWATGTTVLQWSMSTKTTVQRDWMDIWIQPYATSIQLPLEDYWPDLVGEPQRAIHIRGANSILKATDIRNHVTAVLPGSGAQWSTKVTPSASRRTPFEAHISSTHIKVGMPAHTAGGVMIPAFWWIDRDFATPLDWTRGTVSFGHHSYNPYKDCDVEPPPCGPNTLHWSGISMSQAVPFYISKASPAHINATIQTVTLAEPSPAGAKLRFSANGTAVQISFNGGSTWVSATQPPVDKPSASVLHPYFHNLPTGTTSLMIRGTAPVNIPWVAHDPHVWNETLAVAPTPTPGPTSTTGPTATPEPTTTQIPTFTPTSTAIPPTATEAPTSTPASTPVPPTSTTGPTATPEAVLCHITKKQGPTVIFESSGVGCP